MRTHINRMRRFITAKERLDSEQNDRVQEKEEKIAQREEEEKQSGKKKIKLYDQKFSEYNH